MAHWFSENWDRWDRELENWVRWYYSGAPIGSFARSDMEKDRVDGQPNFEVLQALTLVPCLDGEAIDTDHKLYLIQGDVTKALGPDKAWRVGATLRHWYWPTFSREGEAAFLGIPRQTHEDRVEQIRRRLQDMWDARPISIRGAR